MIFHGDEHLIFFGLLQKCSAIFTLDCLRKQQVRKCCRRLTVTVKKFHPKHKRGRNHSNGIVKWLIIYPVLIVHQSLQLTKTSKKRRKWCSKISIYIAWEIQLLNQTSVMSNVCRERPHLSPRENKAFVENEFWTKNSTNGKDQAPCSPDLVPGVIFLISKRKLAFRETIDAITINCEQTAQIEPTLKAMKWIWTYNFYVFFLQSPDTFLIECNMLFNCRILLRFSSEVCYHPLMDLLVIHIV